MTLCMCSLNNSTYYKILYHQNYSETDFLERWNKKKLNFCLKRHSSDNRSIQVLLLFTLTNSAEIKTRHGQIYRKNMQQKKMLSVMTEPQSTVSKKGIQTYKRSTKEVPPIWFWCSAFQNTVEIYVCWCCCNWNKPSIVSELDIQILVSFATQQTTGRTPSSTSGKSTFGRVFKNP